MSEEGGREGVREEGGRKGVHEEGGSVKEAGFIEKVGNQEGGMNAGGRGSS